MYEREPQGVIFEGQGARFNGISIIGATTCEPGVLRLTGSGQMAQGEAPVLEVALNSHVLEHIAFHNRKTVIVKLPQAGWLTLAYFNDFYQADVRIAVLENIKLSGTCATFKGTIPANTGGQWLPADNTAYVVSSPGLTLWPCGAGHLSALLSGRAGGGAFPKVEFVQDSQVLRSVQTGAQHQLLQLNVSGQPLLVRVKQPYARLIGDRNLHIHDITFTPKVQP